MRVLLLFTLILFGALPTAKALQVKLVNNESGHTEWTFTPPQSSSPIIYNNLRAELSVGYAGYQPLSTCTVYLQQGKESFSSGQLDYPSPHPFWSWLYRAPQLKLELMIDEVIGDKPAETYGFKRYISPRDNTYSGTLFLRGLNFNSTGLNSIEYSMMHQGMERVIPPAHSFFLTRWVNNVIEVLFDNQG